MNIRGVHYSQQSKEVGRFLFNKGEDAFPFVGDDFLMVADGLGGDGFFVHERMNPEMWGREARRKLFNVPGQDNVLNDYFDDLFQEMDRDAVDGKKPERYDSFPKYELHSGYFGSRIAAYCLVKTLRHDERFAPGKLFETLDLTTDEKEYQSCLDRYAAQLCDTLQADIKEIASRGGFEMESDRKNAKLLPTTIAFALYRDVGDETQVICLWAGDSRVVAQLADGCVQLTEDDEKNEGMTNLLFQSDTFKPHLNIREYRFKRPFALLAVTDGTFDDIGGNMHFEALVILNALECDTREKMLDTWNELFVPPFSTDDSASIAYCLFGMEDMEACNRFVEPRVREINEKYIAAIPELFDGDFKIEIQRLRRSTKSMLRPFQDEIKADPHVVDSYVLQVQKDSPTLQRIVQEYRKAESGLKTQILETHRVIRTFYENRWEEVRPHSRNPENNDLARLLRSKLSDLATCKLKYIDKLETLRREAQCQFEDFNRLIEAGLSAAEKGILSCSPQGITEEGLKRIVTGTDDILYELEAFGKSQNGIRLRALSKPDTWRALNNDYNSCKKEADSLRRQLLMAEEDQLNDHVKRVEAEEEAEEVANLPPEIRAKKEKLRDLNAQMEALEKKRKEAIVEEAQKQAESSMGNILDNLLDGEGLLERLSDDLRGRLEAILGPFRKTEEEYKRKNELQKKILQEYDERYMRLIREE